MKQATTTIVTVEDKKKHLTKLKYNSKYNQQEQVGE